MKVGGQAAGDAVPDAPSLAARLRRQAIAHLSRRDHSRAELGQKLRVTAARWLRSPADANPDADADVEAEADAAERFGEATAAAAVAIEAVLDRLAQEGLLDEARMAESRIHARQARHGNRRIILDLAQRGVDVPSALLSQLADTERERAQALWAQRFPQPAADDRERVRRIQFMLRRGFSAALVQQLARENR